MQEKLDQWINWVEYDELLEGRHNAPHNILGLHDFGKGQIFTVYRPEAKAVTVTDMRGNHPTELEEVEPGSGFFGKYVESRKKLKAPYLLNIKYGEDDVVVTADPYCFAPQLSSLDLYLFAEGKHYQIFDKLGAHPMFFCHIYGTEYKIYGRRYFFYFIYILYDQFLNAFRHWCIHFPASADCLFVCLSC